MQKFVVGDSEENTQEQEQTNTDHLADHCSDTHTDDEATHTQQKLVRRDSANDVKAGVRVEKETNDGRLEDEESEEEKEREITKDTDMEPIEREEESTDTLR